MKKLLIVSVILAAAFGVHFVLGQPRANANADINAGDLIRGETFSAVYYYGADGFRYVFPNEKTYFTWCSDFDTVEFVTDAQLGEIPIGGNATYKPGIKMLKIQSDPKTYAISGNGTMRHVTSEAVAVSLYGSNWNQQIDDVPDAFFSNYTVGDPITDVSSFNKANIIAAASSINVDKALQTPIVFSITDSAYVPIDVTVDAGRVVKFVNNGSTNHTATGDDLSWGSGTIMPGKSFQRAFEDVGTFTFFDSYNSQLTGAIFVE